MIRELGFSRATASAIYNGQQYTQSLIDKLAPWLNARPYELLLPPERAFALRRMEQSAKEIASDPAIAPDPDAPAMLRVVK